MYSRLIYELIFLLAMCINPLLAHPTGSIVAVGDVIAWSYVSPIGDLNHHACVMTWSENEGVDTWLVSENDASDWMISPADSEHVYLIERYYDHAANGNRYRLLFSKIGGVPEVRWPWSEDTQRIGEGGFVMLSEDEILFARYPHVYRMKRGESPVIWNEFSHPVSGLRPLEGGQLLVHSEREATLVDSRGQVSQHWENLLEEVPESELPFHGNRVFDLDYSNECLWVAYWGKRRFDRWMDTETFETIHQLEKPFLPHGVVTSQHDVFLLASSLDPGVEITPRLWKWREDQRTLIWSDKPVEITPTASDPASGN